MKLNEVMQIISTIIPLAAAIWQIAEMKNQLDKKFEIFVGRYEERKELVDYLIADLRAQITHKFQRCMDEIKALSKSE